MKYEFIIALSLITLFIMNVIMAYFVFDKRYEVFERLDNLDQNIGIIVERSNAQQGQINDVVNFINGAIDAVQ